MSPVKGSPSHSPVTHNLAKARQHAGKLIRRIRAAHEGGDHRKTRALSVQYLQSMDARFIAVVEAYRHLPPRRRPQREELFSYAQSLAPWEGTGEPVRLWFKPKRDNPCDFRPILDFGLTNRSLQYLVRPLLEAQADLDDRQYLMRGGVPAAIRRVANLLERGCRWAIETDIAQCYQSFDGEKAADLLPLPKEVTRSTLLGASLNIQLGKPTILGPAGPEDEDDDELVLAPELADARRGFPQGSATSPLAVEILLSGIYRTLPRGAFGSAIRVRAGAAGYADNLLVIARGPDDAWSMTEAFWSAVQAHPVGQLRVKSKVFEGGMPIEFLGHRLCVHEGEVQISTTEQNRTRFRAQVENRLDGIVRSGPASAYGRQQTRQLHTYVRSWAASFQLCADADALVRKALALSATISA